MPSLPDATGPLPGLALLFLTGLALILYLLGRSAVLGLRLHSQKRLLYKGWENYLDALQTNLERLQALRDRIADFRPGPDQPALSQAAQDLFDRVREEIRRTRDELARLAELPDRHWFDNAPEWRAAPPIDQEIAQLLQAEIEARAAQDQARQSHERLSRENNDWQARLDQTRREHEQRTQELEAQLHELQELQNQPAPQNEAAIAARHMAQLAEGLDAEQANARQAACQGEIQHLRNQLTENQDPAEQEAIQGRIDWQEQCLRWWKTQNQLIRKTALLDQATGQAMQPEPDSEADTEAHYDFQNIEAQNAELRKRLANLGSENRQLSQQLDSLQNEEQSATELRELLAKVNKARLDAERELQAIESILGELERDHEALRARNAQLWQAQSETKQRLETLEKELEETRAAQSERETQLLAELSENRQLRQQYERQLQDGQVEGMVPEAEVLELQIEYDQLNHQLAQLRSQARQAEKEAEAARKQAHENQVEKERLAAQHSEDREKYQALQQELETLRKDSASQEKQTRKLREQLKHDPEETDPGMVPEAEVIQLQEAYDELNATLQRTQADNEQLRQAEKQAILELQTLQRRYSKLREQQDTAGGEAPSA